MESNNFLYVYNLVQGYLKHVCQEPALELTLSKPAQVLRKTASSLGQEVEESLRLYLDSLEITSVDDARRIFGQVMETEFADGNINWGRILTIFLFGGILTKRLQGCGVPLTKENMDQISHFMTDYIVNTKAKWISENGGWDNGFVTKFEDQSSWLSLHNVKSKVMAVFSFFSQYY
ncbi:bcl-2-related protein A1 isoform X1 [Sceloporus undulatus]|uniref:bcl-2-related protein A1 isoform X1 n=1 Tax=Sceloporus undulatus TaxID=8520 RepID=UPI001C4AFB55|nr:bcl-2-related protein A1 isoform X1 [Sceloporus undulatus]